MMITFDDFMTEWTGKGIDFDHAYGYQCMDLAEEYNKEVVGGQRFNCNAVDVPTHYDTDKYDLILNAAALAPNKGDLVVWGAQIGPNGHIAVAISANAHSFTSFDQNWPLGALCHPQIHSSYHGVIGWLRPKAGASSGSGTSPIATPSFPARVTVTNPSGANVREMPNQNSPLAGDQKLALNATFVAVAIVTGSDPYGNGNNRWYQAATGNYVWSGNCSSPQPISADG